MDWLLLLLIAFALWFGYRVSKVGWLNAKAEVAGFLASIGGIFGKMGGWFQ